MAGFDNLGVFFSDNLISEDGSRGNQNSQATKAQFREFLRNFHEGNFIYKYRDQIRHHYAIEQFWIEISLQDITSYDENLAEKVIKYPNDNLHLLEEAVKDVADELTTPRPEGENVQDMQVQIQCESNTLTLRDLKSEYISKLVKIPGIVISASNVRSKATRISLQCRGCGEMSSDNGLRPGLDGFLMPRKCNSDQNGKSMKCPLDPYFIMPDKSKCVDFQNLKLQEAPETTPHGEMPRHLQLYCDRYLCEKAVPGNRVTVVGIYSIKKYLKPSKSAGESRLNVGIRSPYLRVIGIHVETESSGHASFIPLTPDEEEIFTNLACSDNIYDRISKSIAPSIFGHEDMKKAVACLLFSGSRKLLPDGLTRRGDINVLFLGDPGTAKSQLLKFAEKVAPIGVYTSGKGSSAAGLTASVMRDPSSRNFVMEGGAMVLADGGCVCIDEFDKMREDDRVAIHEAMEQQTISIAKAGITTTLNSRCAVLAAANSVFGRWDDSKSDQNIDFMPTILARFDMIFIVKDEHNEIKDRKLAEHVMSVHTNAQQTMEENNESELSLNFLKKYISFCRSKCGPRLSASAGNQLAQSYVNMRNGSRDHELTNDGKKSAIPITVRQLEAIIRISESLAKMKLLPFATEVHVAESIRLFRVSTLKAASSGDLAGAEGFTTDEEHQNFLRIEKQIKKRFNVGSQLPEKTIILDMAKQHFNERAVNKVLQCMIRKGLIQYRSNRKFLYRAN